MKCKRIIKVVSALALTLALLVSSGVVSFAATYTTTTKYLNRDTIEVTSVASNLHEGDMVTYVAYKGNDFSQDNAVYIDQATAKVGENGTVEDVTFTYQADSDNVKATVKFGGSTETDGQLADEYGYNIKITVNGETYNEKYVVPTVDGDAISEEYLARVIPVDLVAGQAVDTVKFIAEGDAAATPVDVWYVKDGAIVVVSNVIQSNGELVITTKETTVSVTLGAVETSTNTITAFAKAVCADDASYGISIIDAKSENSFEGSWRNGETIADEDYVVSQMLFPAAGKGADGGFCVEVQDETHFVAGRSFKVAAYVMDDEAVYSTKIETVEF